MHLLPLLLFVEALTRAQAAIVIGIDFGTDSIKVGLRSPGPLSDPIRYNRASKRKTPAIVAIDQGKRILEDGAMAVVNITPILLQMIHTRHTIILLHMKTREKGRVRNGEERENEDMVAE